MKNGLLIISVLVLTTYAFAEIIHVPADQPTIQAGLMAATEGDTVLVAPNTYTENIFWPSTNGIKLMSENGPGNTIIDGSNTSTVIYMYGGAIDTTTVIDGFTLQNGNADAGSGISCLNASPKVENCVIENNEGGGCDFTNSSAVVRDSEISNNNGIGIKCKENSNITVTGSIVENNNGSGIYFHSSTGNVSDCEITDNSASDGGGMYCYYSSPSLENVTISNNSAYSGGGIYCYSSSPTLTNVTIADNSASSGGGGMYCQDYSSPTLSNVTITGNSASYDGGGIYCFSSSSPTLSNVTITGNSAYDGGGIYYLASSPSLENVTIADNSAFYGGGMFCDQSNPNLSNVTITGNSASEDGGGMCCYYQSNPTLSNVTITGNSAYDGGGIYCYYNSSPSLANVTITNNSASYGGGIYCSSSSPTLENCTITENSAATEGDGIYTTDNSEPTVHYSNIMLNGYGIFNNDPSVMVDASDNFWGDESGPYHPFWNPGGLGDSVNQYVNPLPYLAVADTTAPPIPPFGLDTLEVGEDFVTINWQNSPIGDLAGYKVYFNSDSTGFPYADTVLVGLDTTYTFFNLSAEDTIYAAITCYDNSGEESWYSKEVVVTTESIVSNSEGNFAAPKDFRLFQNYPNPFNPITTISYQIQKSGNINIEIYNIKGQLVETLVNEQKTSGSYSVTWDAKECSSGIYLYKLKMNGKSESVRRCLLLK